jgi:hypothetical protein
VLHSFGTSLPLIFRYVFIFLCRSIRFPRPEKFSEIQSPALTQKFPRVRSADPANRATIRSLNLTNSRTRVGPCKFPHPFRSLPPLASRNSFAYSIAYTKYSPSAMDPFCPLVATAIVPAFQIPTTYCAVPIIGKTRRNSDRRPKKDYMKKWCRVFVLLATATRYPSDRSPSPPL